MLGAGCAPAPPAPAPWESSGAGRGGAGNACTALPARVVKPPLPFVDRQPSEALVARDAPLHTFQTHLLLARGITQPRHTMGVQIPFPYAIG